MNNRKEIVIFEKRKLCKRKWSKMSRCQRIGGIEKRSARETERENF